tara:strand:+ start:576 stop:1100 length:525 start_codon:yes stop_codon:yes gene_type:complete
MLIYTDGSCHGNPGKGGWALYCPETGLENWGNGGDRTTNNRMELTAILNALKVPGVTVIITDSDYCLKGCTKWAPNWAKKDWKTAAGAPVKNDDLWKEILALGPDRVEFRWVKAHAGNEHNVYVDNLANKAAEKPEAIITDSELIVNLQRELEILDTRRDEINGKLKSLREKNV